MTDPKAARRRKKRLSKLIMSKRFDAAVRRWEKKLKPQTDAVRDSTRLTADDYKIIVY